MENKNINSSNVIIPKCWKNRMNPDLIEALKETAEKEPEFTDEYGDYKKGVFLYQDCMIIVDREQEVWGVLISSIHPLGLQQLKDIRKKFVPDYCVMAHVLPGRNSFTNNSDLHSYNLFEIPKNQENEEV